MSDYFPWPTFSGSSTSSWCFWRQGVRITLHNIRSNHSRHLKSLSIGIAFYALSINIDPWDTETVIFHFLLCWVTFGSLCFLLIFRFAAIMHDIRTLFKGFDLLAYTSDSQPTTIMKKLFGRLPWKKHFVWVRYSGHLGSRRRMINILIAL